MDLQSFCVENRRKVHSFPFLRSAVHSKDKMSKSFQFGMPVGNTTMEENCLKNIHNISCNAQFDFQGITKSQDCQPKKSCFDQLNKFSHFTFSRVVGGFVGSKSQGCSASREPHQVWDVIFRQLVATAYEATMNTNTQQYFSIGEAVSQSIFGHFNNCKNSSLGFSSYIFPKSCKSFESKGATGNMQSSNNNPSTSNADGEDRGQLNKVRFDSQLHSVNVKSNATENKSKMFQSTSKQSYADVAKAFIAARRDCIRNSERHPTSQYSSLSQKNKPAVFQLSRKENESVYNKNSRQRSTCYTQPSYNNSSQNQLQKKHTMLLEKCDDKVPSKFIRDKHQHTRRVHFENSHLNKQRTKLDRVQQSASAKERSPEDRKSRYGKFRGRNMREKERRSIGLQLQEESVYACNMSEENCQNWRCDHNRNFKICRTDSHGSKEEYKSNKYKQQSRLHSPPPRTFVRDVIKKCESKTNDNYSIKNDKEDPMFEKICEETLCNIEKSTPSSSLNLSKDDDSSESSVSSISTNNAIVLPQRPRVASECSIDSEDSYVVFEKDDHLVEDTNDREDSDSSSIYDSDSDSEEDCDEVDFYFFQSEDISFNTTENVCADAFSPVPERLRDINKKWQNEIALLPKVERIPKKVHFPNANDLVKVHHMICWPFAYREARRGHWEEIGRDRCRFQSRIQCAEQDLACVLDPEHRRRIWEERMCDVKRM